MTIEEFSRNPLGEDGVNRTYTLSILTASRPCTVDLTTGLAPLRLDARHGVADREGSAR